jgi:urea transporter
MNNKVIKILKSIARAGMIVFGALLFGVSLFAILNNLDKQWSIVSLVCMLIGIVAFIDYKINN